MQCNTILEYLQRLYDNQPDIREMVDAHPFNIVWKEVRGLNTAPNHGVTYALDGTIIPNEDNEEESAVLQNAEQKSN